MASCEWRVARDSVDGADILEISGEKREASGGGRLCCVGADFVPLGDSRLAKTVLDVLGKTRRMFGKERHTASPGWGIDDQDGVDGRLGLGCRKVAVDISPSVE
jgi:hypothetical protein